MEDMKNVIEKIDSDQITLCIDTSALLETYAFSPDIFRFIYECFTSLKEKVFIPATVAREFLFQYTGHFKKAQNNSSMLLKKLSAFVENEMDKIKTEMNRMNEYHYPSISSLLSAVDSAKGTIDNAISDYNTNNPSISTLEENYYNDDYFGKLICEAIDSKPNNPLSIEKIYSITENADKCKDYFGKRDKKKPGLKKYNDLLIWNEIIEYSKTNNKDVILLTHEAKNDWFDNVGTLKKEFVQQFTDCTNHSIEVTNRLLEFYTEYGRIHGIEPKDATRLSLECLFENMIDSKEIESKLFDSISARVIDNMCSEYCFGQFESFEDGEVAGIDFLEAEIVQFETETRRLICRASYKTTISAVGKTYSGYDREDNDYYYLCSKCILSGVSDVFVDIREGEEPILKFHHGQLHLDDYDESDIVIE